MRADLKTKVMRLLGGSVVVLGLLMMWQPAALAHHGSNNYDTERLVTVKGTVTRFMWANPHCQLYFDATDAKGNVVHWGVEMNQPRMLSVQGWTPDVMKPGDKVTVTGHPAKSGAPRMFLDHIVLASGRVLMVGRGIDQNGNKGRNGHE